MSASARGSPDANWSDPRFVMRRLLRRPTVPLKSYEPLVLSSSERGRLVEVASTARCPKAKKVAFVFGVMPRSGTNFLERLLLTHPDTCGAPDDLRELPALAAADRLERSFAARLAQFYAPNGDLFARHEWLVYALAGYLNSACARSDASAQLMLLKDPHIRHLNLFEFVLPGEKALIVLRDGRYLIDSTVRTWPLKFLGRTFEDICLEWDAATRAALDYVKTAPPDRVRLVRYEDLVVDCASEIIKICDWLDLDTGKLDDTALTGAPVLGSSTHSRTDVGNVDWKPVPRDGKFDPTGRTIEWRSAHKSTFNRICGKTQSRAGYQTW